MFAVPTKIITPVTLIASLLLSGLAQADTTDSCFNFLNARDYARAENEAKQLLQGGHLDRIDERNAQLCLGKAHSSTRRDQEALTAFQQVASLSQSTEEFAPAYMFLGSAYYHMNDLVLGELYYQRALKAYRELGNERFANIALFNLAGLANDFSSKASHHLAHDEYKSAINLYRQAIAICRRSGDTVQTAYHQIKLGDTLRLDKQYGEAEKELRSGLTVVHLQDSKNWEVDACIALGWLAVADNNPKKECG